MQRPFREPHLLPVRIGNTQNLLPELLRILSFDTVLGSGEVRHLFLSDKIMRQIPGLEE